ncbi:MAG TPA: hypothetical protein VGP93_13505 [Polyangiaceae bacterium]|nr:hypothetical protein [Polyangiaceae bacterium]
MLSVTCPKCNARYTMSEELYMRKGGGEAVIVTCRRCKSEVRFEAREEKTKPSNEIPMDMTSNKDGPKPEAGKDLNVVTEDPGPFVALSSGFFGSAPSESLLPKDLSPSMPEISMALDSDSVELAPPKSQPIISIGPAVDVSIPPQSIPAAPGPAVMSSAPPNISIGPAVDVSIPPESIPAAPAIAAMTAAASPPDSGPESTMPVDSSELLGDDQVMSVRGTDMVEQTETVPLVFNKSSNGAGNTAAARPTPVPPAPSATAAAAGAKAKKPVPSPPRKQREVVEDEAPPSSSGIPTLTKLMGESGASIAPKKMTRTDEAFLLGLNSPSTPLAPPTIDLSALSAPPVEAEPASGPVSERSADSIPASSRHPHKKKKKKKHGSIGPAPELKSTRPSTSVPVTRPTPSAAPTEPAPARSNTMWIVFGMVALAGIAAYVYTSKSKGPDEPRAEQALSQPAAPTAPTAAAAPTIAEPAVPTASAAAPAVTASAATRPTVNKPAESKPVEGTSPAPASEAKPAAEAKPEEKPAAEAKPEAPPATGNAFQPDAAKAALGAAAAQASGCRKGDDPTGSAVVIITFAPSGRVTSANISGPPFAGTATGGCIAAAMRKASVPPFDGDRITVSKTINVQ